MFKRKKPEDDPPLPPSMVAIEAYAEAHGITHEEAVSIFIRIGTLVTERVDAGHEFFVDDGATRRPIDWHLPPLKNDPTAP